MPVLLQGCTSSTCAEDEFVQAFFAIAAVVALSGSASTAFHEGRKVSPFHHLKMPYIISFFCYDGQEDTPCYVRSLLVDEWPIWFGLLHDSEPYAHRQMEKINEGHFISGEVFLLN